MKRPLTGFAAGGTLLRADRPIRKAQSAAPLVGYLLLLLLPLLLLSSCTPPTTTPLGTVNFSEPSSQRHDTLLVFLPGLRDGADVFAERGFIAAVRKEGVAADMMGVDAHVGYYKEKKLLGRLKGDVIEPAKRRGYRHIWLVGISLGGFGAIWYDLENPGDLAGIVSLSPYLGEAEMVDEVARAGGLRKWQPPAGRELDDQHRIWRGLKSYQRPERTTGRVFLGYGMNDKFARPDSMLAAVLPKGQVMAVEGGHDWPTWQRLWNMILRKRLFCPADPQREPIKKLNP